MRSVVSFVLVVLLAAALAPAVAAAPVNVPPGATHVTPQGNTVMNNGTEDVVVDAWPNGEGEGLEVLGDDAVVTLTQPGSDATIAGDGNTVHHQAPDTTADTQGSDATAQNADESKATPTASGGVRVQSTKS